MMDVDPDADPFERPFPWRYFAVLLFTLAVYCADWWWESRKAPDRIKEVKCPTDLIVAVNTGASVYLMSGTPMLCAGDGRESISGVRVIINAK